ncbi:hypothetical protein HMI54_006559 [Coelomomyces lativittatus]|nr:hypothetical protein HMI54_006559 [Coelomomyces lativittatus]KAJ1514858.1 hypothetical protein HMI56_007220 [Coelomomyces lativittatus]
MRSEILHTSQNPSSVQRRPFRFSNSIIGLSLVTFAIGIYTYSMYAVKQDKFEDVEKKLTEAREKEKLVGK